MARSEHIAHGLGKTVLHTCSDLFKSVQTFSHLFTSVHTCSQLFTPVHSCSHLFTPVHNCSHLFIPVHTCPLLFTPVHTCSHLFTPVHNCSHLFTPFHTCSHLSDYALCGIAVSCRISPCKSCYLSILRPILLKLQIFAHLIERFSTMYGLCSCIEIKMSIPLGAHA